MKLNENNHHSANKKAHNSNNRVHQESAAPVFEPTSM